MEKTVAVRIPEDLKKKLEKRRIEMGKKIGTKVSLSQAIRSVLAEALA